MPRKKKEENLEVPEEKLKGKELEKAAMNPFCSIFPLI